VTTPKLQLPELIVGQAGKELTHNQALAVLDQLAQAVVVDKDLTAPPGSPANGSMYIVSAGATGAWSGQSGKLAYWLTTVSAWTFITPADGWSVWVTDEDVRYERKAGAWVVVATGGGGGSVSNVYATAAISSGVLTLNFATAQTFGVMLNQNVTSLVLSGAVSGQRCEISVIFSQSAIGGFSVTKPGSVIFPDGATSIASTVSSQLTLVTFTTVDAGTTWLMNSREVFSPAAPIVLPIITTENFIYNSEGDSTTGWSGTNATFSTSSSWHRTTKTAGGSSSGILTLSSAISTKQDFIWYVSARATSGSNAIGVLRLIGPSGWWPFSIWLNSAGANTIYTEGAVSIQGYDGTTVRSALVSGATASSTVAVKLAIHYDSKFDSLTVWVRQPDGRFKFGCRISHSFSPITAIGTAFTDNSAAASWIEFDYFSLAKPNLAVIGDSIAEGANGFSPNTGAGLTNDETTWMRHAPLYPSLRNNLIVNKGVGSNTSAMILSRIADVTALGAEVVFLHCSTNDAVGPVAQATRKTNIQSSVDAIVAAGAEVVLLNSVYGTESNSLNPGIRNYYKDSWDNYMSTVTGVTTKIDIMLPILSANGFMEDSMSDADDIHLNASGAAAVGAYITP